MRLSVTILALVIFSVRGLAQDEPGVQFFEARIRPILADHCYGCHSAGAKKLKGKLFLDSREGVLKGGETGAAIVLGRPEQSRMIEAVGYANVDLQMPPKEKLSDRQIADLTAWVKMGAPWGKGANAAAAATTTTVTKVDTFNLAKRRASHWCWQPVRVQAAPPVHDTAWPRSDIDRFILARLEANHLHPAPSADRRTLIRRVYFDLIGLPPTPAEVEDFVKDAAPDAFEKVVDRLLASPRFGERWGRHWLDLARYAETMGHEFDFAIPNAWRYRDYVIRAFNADVPYDRFLTEQIAGDVLPEPRRSPDGDDESIVGTAFWFFGEDVQAPVDVRQHQADLFDNRIDVFGKSMLGLTIACARCHDHKFDAISTADYYALYGYMKGMRYTQAAVNDRSIEEGARRLDGVKRSLRRAVATKWLAHLDSLVGPLRLTLPADCEDAATLRAGDAPLPGSWFAQGAGFGACEPGDFVVDGDDRHPVVAFPVPSIAHSGLRSTKLEGYFRSQTFTIDKPYLQVQAAGNDARLNVVIDNFVVIRDPIYGGLRRPIKSPTPAWITIDLKMWQGRQAYLELADCSISDPGGPPAPRDGWIQFEQALLSEHASPPRVRSATEKLDDPLPLVRSSLEQWRDGRLAQSTDARRRAAILGEALRKGWLDAPAHDPGIASILDEYHRIEASIPAPLYTPAAADGNTDDEHIFIRGNPKTLGPVVGRRLLTALGGDAEPSRGEPGGSGRLELARRVTDPANPLTARVMVNRVWHHLFGRGIVASVDNFGALGERPSHPELLDYLAHRFVHEDAWSTKRLIREIVLTSTYRQSAAAAPGVGDSAMKSDPTNTLLYRANVRRLEAESIRDLLLSVSGRLDLTMYGPGVQVHLTPFMEGRGRPDRSGPLDGNGRRSIYLDVRRNFLNPMLLAFDTPTPFNTMGRRSVSNVPAQALILMNDPFVLEQAQLWARRALADKSLPPEARLTRMYESAFARPPTQDELRDLLAFIDEQGQAMNVAADQRATNLSIWTAVAHALVNTKEFIFLN
ncbi:MAG TPA: PSD1 and planctomycete cytochrome C domain-containing protein [Tepidisphaeraceae bacterium]|jgi:cytochrome c553